MTETVVQARIDERVKDEATAVLATVGLTASDAFRLMMIRIAEDKALPFEPLVPNADTVEAMKAARRGDLVSAKSIDALFADLNAGDLDGPRGSSATSTGAFRRLRREARSALAAGARTVGCR